jgi:hypothetical protein
LVTGKIPTTFEIKSNCLKHSLFRGKIQRFDEINNEIANHSISDYIYRGKIRKQLSETRTSYIYTESEMHGIVIVYSLIYNYN